MVILRDETIIIMNIIATISIYVTYSFLSNFNRRLYAKKKDYILGYFLFILILTFVNLFIPGISIIVACIGIVILGHSLYNNEKIYIIYYFIFSVFLVIGQLVFAEGFKIIVTFLNINVSSIDMYFISNAIIIQIANLACLRLFLALFKTKINKLTFQHYFSFLLLPVFSIIYILTLVKFIQNQWVANYNQDLLLFIINIVLIGFFNVFITNIFEAISKNNELKYEIELYENKKNIEYEYYTSLEDKYNDSRKVIHDIKNHMQTIDSLYELGDRDKAKTYLKDMYGLLDSLGQTIYTENKILNIIINDKASLAKKSNMEMEVLVGDIDINFMKEIDITTIISNLLDNAIDAANETENKKITLKIVNFNDFLVINVTNSFKTIKVIDDNFKTTKENHLGLGLKNIRVTAEKYSGTMNIKTSDGIFKVNIMIPN